MHKNILIIGYGDIGRRLKTNIKNANIYAVGRSPEEEGGIHKILWDWLSNDILRLNNITFDSIIIIPKPSDMTEEGYTDGFIKSLSNIKRSLQSISFKKIIAISSTRVYGSNQLGLVDENSPLEPCDFRGRIIKKYESILNDKYFGKLTVLRFSGLYDDSSQRIGHNRLHRNNAAKIIIFFINRDLNFKNNCIVNCSEDTELDYSKKCVSNKKIKDIGFIFE
tara:strand:+ start:152 stop:817 length:666 start_codon:yes stop_codon:yes gene_type:complete